MNSRGGQNKNISDKISLIYFNQIEAFFTHSSSLKIFPHNNDFYEDPSNFENWGAMAPTPGNDAPAQAANKEEPQKQLKLKYSCAFISETSLSECLLFPWQFL